jgi:hypothetical protein
MVTKEESNTYPPLSKPRMAMTLSGAFVYKMIFFSLKLWYVVTIQSQARLFCQPALRHYT